MKRLFWVLIVLCSYLSLYAIECKCSDIERLNNYRGDIGGKYKIGMTLIYNGNEVSGVYFYNKYLKDIKITGKILDGNKIILEEYNTDNKIVAKFHGRFIEYANKDPRKRYGDSTSKLSKQIIVGMWKRVDRNMNYEFYLSSYSQTPRFKGLGRYGTKDDSVIEKSAQDFWRAVRDKDKMTVSKLIRYPISAKIDKKWIKIKNKNILIKNYNKIFTSSFRKKIINSVPHNMDAMFSYRSSGVMLDGGIIWFGFDGKVKSINNGCCP